ncbi:uncharacterized protein Rv2082-like [Dermacentor albipictus]|uniref:uncharacterized protein Rv2082-like n=1 Tax=Dermacentor albipictus TaxID=60249 RepID=UPI0031FC7C95
MSPKKSGTGKDVRSTEQQKIKDDNPKDAPRNSQTKSKSGGPKNSHKNSKNDAPKHSTKNVAKVAPKDSLAQSPKHAPKNFHKDVHNDAQNNVQKNTPKDSHQDGEVDVPKDVNQYGERLADKDNHRDVPHEHYDHAAATTRGTHHASGSRQSSADILREIIRRQLADEGYVPITALPGNQPRLPAPGQAQQLYAPLGSSSVVPAGPSRFPDYHGMSTAPTSTRNMGFGNCSCHPACTCQKPCPCEPSPCPCKGPSVSGIHSAGSGTIISSVMPIPVPYPMPGYDGGAGGSGNIANAGSNEPIIINPYPPSTSSAPAQPTAPANPAPITVHDIVSLMTSHMMKNIRDDLLRRWGLPVPDEATRATAAPPVAVPGPSLQAPPAPTMALPYTMQQPTSFVPFVGPTPPYPTQPLTRVANEPRAPSAPASRRRHHTAATTHKHTASARPDTIARIEDLEELSDSLETQEVSMATGSKTSSKGPRRKGGMRGRR